MNDPLTSMSPRGFRGYVTSRPIHGNSYPHRIQNLVLRDYARQRKLAYQLSSTEYSTPHCYMMLEDLVNELGTDVLGGIIAFSLFSFPAKPERRRKYYERVLETRSEIHFALEQVSIKSFNDIQAVERIYQVGLFLPDSPMEGRYLNAEPSQSFREFSEFLNLKPNSW